MSDEADQLARIATAIEVLVEDVERRRRQEEESRNWERIPLGWLNLGTCLYCKRTNVRVIHRGIQTFGCEGCVGEFLLQSTGS